MPNVRRLPQQTRSIPITTPAPYKGLNTVASLADMDPAYGLSIQNFIASPQGLAMRQGFRKWAYSLPGATTSLLAYNGKATGSSKLFAVIEDKIYDVTAGGDMSAAVAAVTGLNAAYPYWQYAHQTYSTSSTSYLVAVNGANMPRLYNGSWSAATQVAVPASPGQFKNVDNNGNAVSMDTFVDVTLHQQRLWFVRESTTLAYYCDIGAVGGTLHAFDFGPYFKRGGKLQKLDVWTIDSGSGTQSFLVAVSSKGDIAVYAGTDPSSASTWALFGTYQVGAPVGRRCTATLQGDLLLLTMDGLLSLSSLVQSATIDRTQALTYLIQPTISSLVATLFGTSGFEVFVNTTNDTVLLNVPQSMQLNNFQFCYNTIQKGWTQFTGWPAQCFALFNEAAYFGGTDYVALAFSGFRDNADSDGTGGDNLICTALTAFTSFATENLGPGLLKHVKMVKPFLVSGQSNPSVRVGVNVDFNLIPIIGSATVNPATGAVWDTAIWDDGNATWTGSLTTYNAWYTPLSNPGNYMAVAVSVSAAADTIWTSTNWIVSPSNAQFG